MDGSRTAALTAVPLTATQQKTLARYRGICRSIQLPGTCCSSTFQSCKGCESLPLVILPNHYRSHPPAQPCCRRRKRQGTSWRLWQVATPTPLLLRCLVDSRTLMGCAYHPPSKKPKKNHIRPLELVASYFCHSMLMCGCLMTRENDASHRFLYLPDSHYDYDSL